MGVYKKAAILVAEKRCKTACRAMIIITSHMSNRSLDQFRIQFKPENKSLYDLWFGRTSVEKNQLARSLALLFMEEITKDN